MNISSVIKDLMDLKRKYGDVPVSITIRNNGCASENHGFGEAETKFTPPSDDRPADWKGEIELVFRTSFQE